MELQKCLQEYLEEIEAEKWKPRLTWILFLLGLAKTIKQARQFITHGHIAVDGRRVTAPSFIVTRDLESKITYYQNSPFAKRAEV